MVFDHGVSQGPSQEVKADPAYVCRRVGRRHNSRRHGKSARRDKASSRGVRLHRGAPIRPAGNLPETRCSREVLQHTKKRDRKDNYQHRSRRELRNCGDPANEEVKGCEPPSDGTQGHREGRVASSAHLLFIVHARQRPRAAWTHGACRRSASRAATGSPDPPLFRLRRDECQACSARTAGSATHSNST